MLLRIGLISLVFFPAISCAQKKWFEIDRADLDTSFFNQQMNEKLSLNKKNFKIKNKLKWELQDVAVSNAYIGSVVPEFTIQPRFKYRNDSIISVKYYLQKRRITIVSVFRKSKNGFCINVKGGREGHYGNVELTEFKHSKKNGVRLLHYNSIDTFVLEKQIFKNDIPVGKFLSYYPNGNLKVIGDSLEAYNFKTVRMIRFNEYGMQAGYERVLNYDIKKRGKWTYFTESGDKIKEEIY